VRRWQGEVNACLGVVLKVEIGKEADCGFRWKGEDTAAALT
jgi:hypothetical protein